MVLFTFIWKLENFSYFWHIETGVKILSPEFFVTAVVNTRWRLRISNERPGDLPSDQFRINKKFIKVFLERLEGFSLLPLHLHIEVELLKVDGSLLRPRKLGMSSTHFKGSNACVLNETVDFDRSIAEILPQDVLIFQCRMWSTTIALLEEGKCFAQTRLAVERMDFTAEVEQIGDFVPGVTRSSRIKSVSHGKPEFMVNICLSDTGKLVVNVIGGSLEHLGFCEVFILDNCGKWVECGQDSEWRRPRTECEFPLSLSYQVLMDNKQQYFQDNMIKLKYKVSFYSRAVTPQRNDDIEYERFTEKKSEPQILPSTLAEDLVSLCKEGTLCDTKLRTESETFPAHKIVLSARSPVFKKMFTSDMSEGVTDCVDISDLSPDTVRSMLMFMYTDRTAAMDWQGAMELYFAADKYEIDSLKLKCSTFLKLTVTSLNCCDLLLLSDLHQDSGLKQFVQEYIVNRDKDVFATEEWATFKDNHARLAADTMSLVYAKK